MESVFTPGVIAFGWESGTAAFCSLFKYRRANEGLLNVNYERRSTIDATDDMENQGGSNFNLNISNYSKNLFVVWTTFCRTRGPITPQIIVDAIKELAALMSFLQKESSKGVKFICIATNVPAQWIPDAERLVYDVDDLSDDVSRLMGADVEAKSSWSDAPRVDAISKRVSKALMGSNTTAEEVEIGSINENAEFTQSPISASVPTDKVNAGDSGRERRPSLISAKASDPEMTILKLQNREESWVSFRYALTSKWKKFQEVTRKRVESSIAWLNSPDGPDYATFFVPEHQSDVESLREFKYSQIYDEVNRAIIEAHLKYQKNPKQFIDREFGEDGDPARPSVVSCDILYSGDYASTKLDSLERVVDDVVLKQSSLRVPAGLNFVPDA